ncbi:hypothetical protein A1OE_672 [Candidatus Endolissoclinum faulkneri L2]|uniref:Uncharacterized protein n=1 Tax=Candidatus Endolissoclinum faulkneri L2 TaxID=1193729 RepID=K7YH29_9PROT|nr:hypothetical protein A1OE_672 [Candidatus Endolissoclinum faulkneri L2]
MPFSKWLNLKYIILSHVNSAKNINDRQFIFHFLCRAHKAITR